MALSASQAYLEGSITDKRAVAVLKGVVGILTEPDVPCPHTNYRSTDGTLWCAECGIDYKRAEAHKSGRL